MNYIDVVNAFVAEFGDSTESEAGYVLWESDETDDGSNAITVIACDGAVCVSAERGAEPAHYAYWHVAESGTTCRGEVVDVLPIADVIANVKAVLAGELL